MELEKVNLALCLDRSSSADLLDSFFASFSLIPDGDFFQALRSGKGSIRTDHIADFTENSIILKSGEKLEADVVVSATGLEMQMAGGSKLSLDGKAVNIGDSFIYKGQMLQNIPNMAICLGECSKLKERREGRLFLFDSSNRP